MQAGSSSGTVTITAGRLNVRLCNAADGLVVADAIRIVQTSALSAQAPDAAAADVALLALLNNERGGDFVDTSVVTNEDHGIAAAAGAQRQALDVYTPQSTNDEAIQMLGGNGEAADEEDSEQMSDDFSILSEVKTYWN